ncbi:hypothetical protein [Ferruginibacter sp.]|nr:hypothetical protein [Ferruginibacter sp.]
MEIIDIFFVTAYLPLFVLSTFSACIFFAVLVAMALILLGLYRSNINSYHNKINAMDKQLEAMQKHLDYASREKSKARADAKKISNGKREITQLS